MFVRSGVMEMPTMTVAQDLFLRTGSATRYSLSPFQGRGDALGKQLRKISKDNIKALISDGVFEMYVRKKDDFTFYLPNSMHTLYQKAIDTMDVEDVLALYPDKVYADDIQPYHPKDKCGPEYVRKFEDGYSQEYLDKFLEHVISNVMRNDNGYKEYLRTNQVVDYYKSSDDSEEVNECDLQTERFNDSNMVSITPDMKEELAYCLYRFNKLSIRLGINILSMIVAYNKFDKSGSKKKKVDKPSAIVDAGVWYADMNGNCTVKVVSPADRRLAHARRLLTNERDPIIDEFGEDYIRFQKVLNTLQVDLEAEDPTIYTADFIERISEHIMVNNYTYVQRRSGGYNMEILKQLKNLSLDEAQNMAVEDNIDMAETVYDIIRSDPYTPSNVYRAFSRVYRGNPTMAYELIKLIYADAKGVTDWASGMPDGSVSEEGFLLDGFQEYVKVNCPKIVGQSFSEHTFGMAYFHASGYVAFDTRDGVVLLSTFEDYKKRVQLHDNGKGYITIGG